MICNIAAYKFIELDNQFLNSLCQELSCKTKKLCLKGTIIISPEGINLFLAGKEDDIKSFQTLLGTFLPFQGIHFKHSYSKNIPFKKLRIIIKSEMIPCDSKDIKPHQEKASYLSPQTFRKWYLEQREMLVLDTRNKFEFDIGQFQGAEHLNLKNFREFSRAVKNLPEASKSKPVITYCTGGIRCEKAALILAKHGFKEVYQLEGGILNFFSQCGGEFYNGDCFVFDDRIALNAKLEPLKP